jgi:2TM domain-containing protein
MDDFARAAFREAEAKQILRRRVFLLHLAIYVATNLSLVGIWALTGAGHPWFVYPILGWGIGLVAHGAVAYLLSDPEEIVLRREQQRTAAAPQDPPTPSA